MSKVGRVGRPVEGEGTNTHALTKRYYHLADGMGNVQYLAAEDESVVQRYRYTVFGEVEIDGSDMDIYTYSAREYDSDSGMYYYRSRHYNANYGRFDRVDDVRDGVNWYAYGANNPNMYADPFGYAVNVGGNTWKANTRGESPESIVRNNLGGQNYTSAQVTARVNEIAAANPGSFYKHSDGTFGVSLNATFTVPDNNNSAKQAATEATQENNKQNTADNPKKGNDTSATETADSTDSSGSQAAGDKNPAQTGSENQNKADGPTTAGTVKKETPDPLQGKTLPGVGTPGGAAGSTTPGNSASTNSPGGGGTNTTQTPVTTTTTTESTNTGGGTTEQPPDDPSTFTGHKALYGPTGTGCLCIHPSFDVSRLAPFIRGGTGSNSSEEHQPDELPDRYESGTINAIGIAGLLAGMRFIERMTLERMLSHERMCAARLRDGLADLRVHILGAECSTGITSITIDGMHSAAAALLLDDEFSILTRAGLHCAPAVHRTMGTFPHGTVRFSPGFSTTKRDIDTVIRAVRSIIKRCAP